MNHWQRLTKWVWMIAPIAILAAFVIAETQHDARTIAIGNLDYFPLVDRAVRLGFSTWDGWVNWIHPVGFPWLVRIGLELGFDAARFGQAVSIVGGAIGLIGTYLLTFAVFKSRKMALACVVFTASTGYFLYFASTEGNDMPAAGWQILSIGALAYGLSTSPVSNEIRARWIILSAIVAGLSYLMRYTGMLTAAASVLVLMGAAISHRSRALAKMIGLYLVIVVTVTALQWVPSLLTTGSPFSNEQGQNVWFHVYGKSDFLTEWNTAPQGITVAGVFALNPGKFVRHWLRNFEGFWLSPNSLLLDTPLTLFGVAGLIFMLLRQRSARPAVRVLVGLVVLANLGALSLLRLDPRFLIVLAPILVIGAVSFFAYVLPVEWRVRQIRIPVHTLAAVAGLLLATQVPLDFARDVPQPPQRVVEASDALHAAGMHAAGQVLSTHLLLQDLNSLSRRRFTQANDLRLEQDTLANLLSMARDRSFAFMIYDDDAGPKIYPDLTNLLSPESRPAGLTPIYIEPDRKFVIYAVDQDSGSSSSPVAVFDQGVTLDRYRVDISRPVGEPSAWDVGVYLAWRPQQPLRSSYKVFVHLLDEKGQLIAQDDGVPVLWTYPTSRWKPGETVVDFHRVQLNGADPNKPYTLAVGMYDETTGNRLGRVDASGKPIDDKSVLETLKLSPGFSGPQGE